VTDAVFDAGMRAVPGFQERQLSGGGVGDEGLVTPAVGLLEQGQLGAGVGAFAAHDDPHPGRPGAQVEQPGEFGDIAAGAYTAVSIQCGSPYLLGDQRDGRAQCLGECEPDRLVDAAASDLVVVGHPVQQPVGGPGAISADQQVFAVRCRDLGDRGGQDFEVIGGGVAPALPGRRRAASSSVVLSHHTPIG